MFSFIFRRSRKLAFPRSTKDRRLNTKRLPTAARPRPKTSRFDAIDAGPERRTLGLNPGVGLSRKNQENRTYPAGVTPLLLAFESAQNALVRRQHFPWPLRAHDVSRLALAARPFPTNTAGR